ncbi:MAG: UbiA family prenyltransferase [Candidatus Thermoplasmatota archaeon]|nr:UbiA family prenyltransferase [Candidatus Thermoplasmatota archaeon]
MMAALPYLRLLRIRDWLAYFLVATFGFIFSKGYIHSFTEISIFYLMIFLYLGFSFSINECFDIKEDKLDISKKNPIVMGELSLKNALIFSVILAISGTILSTFFGLKVFLFYIALTLLSLFYSSPPLRFKSRFLLDFITHGLFFGTLLFLLPVVIFNHELTQFHYLVCISIFHFSIIMELKNHLEDYKSDKEADLKTTVCVLGLEKSKNLEKLLVMLFPLVLFPVFLFRLCFLPFLVLTALFYLTFLIKKNYRILDIYANIIYGLLIIEVLL